MTIGKKLRMLRDKAGKTQAQVCRDLHIEQSTLANYERDSRTPKIDILRNIAQYYGVSMEYLLDHDAGQENEINCQEIADRVSRLSAIKPIGPVKRKLKTPILDGVSDQEDFMHDVRVLADYFGVSDEYILHGDEDPDSALTVPSDSRFPDGAEMLLDSYSALTMGGRRKLLAFALQLFEQEHQSLPPVDPEGFAEPSAKTGTDDFRAAKKS